MSSDINETVTTVEELQKQIVVLETKESELQKEKTQLEEDFGLRRAKLKELYLQKEEELSVLTEKNSEVVIELEHLKSEVQRLELELEEARSEVTIAHCTAENDVAVAKRQCEEEVATWQQLMKEDIDHVHTHYEAEIKRFKEAIKKIEEEKQYYRLLYEQRIEEEESKSKSDSLLSPNVLSVVTKSLTKSFQSEKVNSLSGSSSGEQESLEISMRKAQDDAALMRSLVVPLEDEIVALKQKIRAQDTQLCAFEAQQQAGIISCDVISSLLQEEDWQKLIQNLEEKLKCLNSSVQAEMASRGDQELCIVILNTQKAMLRDEVNRLRGHLKEMTEKYEKKRSELNELKSTWQKANDHFLAVQRLQLVTMKRINAYLTPDQRKKIKDFQDTNESEKKSEVVKSQSNEGQLVNILEVEEGEFNSSHSQLPEEEFHNSKDKSAKEKLLLSYYTPKILPYCKESLVLSKPDNSSVVPSDSFVVSKKEWEGLQLELKQAFANIEHGCSGCQQFQQQLNKVEGELKDVDRQREIEGQALKRQQQALSVESQHRKEAESKWLQLAKEFEDKESFLRNLVDQVSQKYNETVDVSRKKISSMQNHLYSVAKKREAVQKELSRLQQENDSLVGKHIKHSEELQNEFINLPDTVEEMQVMLLRFREDVIASKVAKEHLEERLKMNAQQHKDEFYSLQCNHQSIQSKLSQEIDEYKVRIKTFENVVAESKEKRAEEQQLKESQHELQESQKRNLHIISTLKRQLEEFSHGKLKYENEIHELRKRVASLQHDLNESEAVQRDFVRLSQSLQVQLEKIRQSEKEVRWQHDDDVEECNACKQRFLTLGRRKHHCNHCGKVFCSDCSSKTVNSGPHSRPLRVCDVCHTLLVQDATPYFSTELPHSPG